MVLNRDANFNMEKKSRVRAGLVFGIFMVLFFIVKELLTHHDLTINDLTRLIGISLFSGTISGILLGLLIGVFSTSKFVSESTRIETAPDENILFETPANYRKGKEQVGGKLYLTNKRLIFKPHELNFQNHELLINLTDIKNVEKYKTAEMINNGLALTTTLGNTERFIVEQADKWMEYLTEQHSS